jgi:hypothetical protein
VSIHKTSQGHIYKIGASAQKKSFGSLPCLGTHTTFFFLIPIPGLFICMHRNKDTSN